MATLLITHTFASGAQILPDEVNKNFSDVKELVNGKNLTNANISGSAAIDPTKFDDYSVSDAQMQTEADPFPSDVIRSPLPVTFAEELEGIRYQLRQLNGVTTHWYEDPNLPVMTTLGDSVAVVAGLANEVNVTGLINIDLPNVSDDATDDTFLISMVITYSVGQDFGDQIVLSLNEGPDGEADETLVFNLTQTPYRYPAGVGIESSSVSNFVFTPAAADNKRIGLSAYMFTGVGTVLGSTAGYPSYITVQKIA